LTALAFEGAWREQNSEAVLSSFADDVELISTEPFPEAGPIRGVSHVKAYIDDHLSSANIDLTKRLSINRENRAALGRPGLLRGAK
jgi:hypothetical protein